MRNGCLSNLARIGFLIALAVNSSVSQTKPPDIPKPAPAAPGKINLPDDYLYQRRQGIDSHVGSIVRSDGFTINHDIGRMAANYAYQYFPEHFERLRKQTHLNTNAIEEEVKFLQDKIEWRQRQKINGEEVMIVFLKDSTIIASFVDSSANFTAKANTREKVADFFLIVLTYQPSLNKRD